MEKKVITMEEVSINRFHYKMFAYAAGSTFVDGYVIGIIAVALFLMQRQFEMSVTMVGLVGMATLAGMFVGGMIGGYLTDIFGRKKMFLIDMLILLLVSILQYFITSPVQLFILRFILGVAIGVDYPIAGALMAEFAPKKNRGQLLGGLNGFWYIGYAISYVVGYLLTYLGDSSWRWMLTSSAVPVAFLLIARLNMPESPRWLVSKGREDEAKAIIQKIFGDNVVMPNDEEETEEKTNFLDIFRNGYGKWVFFVSAFWSLSVIPTFAMGTYIPEIIANFGFADGTSEYLGSALINIIYLVGLIPILHLIEKYGRRPTLFVPFFIASIALFLLGIASNYHLPFGVILFLFVLYGAFNTAIGAHQWVYPNELFPTRIRGTAMGFITGLTRIISAISTFLFPIILETYGLGTTMYLCGGIMFLGFIISFIMAPETKGMSLAEASSITNSVKNIRDLNLEKL